LLKLQVEQLTQQLQQKQGELNQAAASGAQVYFQLTTFCMHAAMIAGGTSALHRSASKFNWTACFGGV